MENMYSKPFQKIVLPNCIRLILVPMEGVNSVATSVMVGVGSRYEEVSINGISHFLEHMVFKGTKKYPTTDDVNEIERIGGLQNAYTHIDITNYHNKVLSTDWQLALEINKELAIKPLLEQKHVDMERNVILEEMKRYEDEPEAKVEEAFHKMLYEGSKLGMRIIGEKESLLATKGETLRGYHDMWYRPERIVVVVAGSIKGNVLRIKEKAEEWFGVLTSQKYKVKSQKKDIEEVKDLQHTPRLEVVTKPDASQAHLILGLRTFARSSEDRYAWNVFNLLMGVSFTSRLFREIREKRGLCYHVRSSSSNWADVGNWSIYAGVATEKVEEATRAILVELTKVVEKGVTEEEVKIAKKRLKTMIAFKSEDPEFMGEYYGRKELFGEAMLTLDEFLQQIDKVTKSQIDELTAKYLTTKTLNMALVWNKPRDEALEGLLRL